MISMASEFRNAHVSASPADKIVGLGQAMIQIAKHLGAEIFVTVSSPEKRNLMMDCGVPEDHIFNSRNLSFAKAIKRMTVGKGVDVVINTLAGEAMRETWHCISPFGRFVELGKRDILANNSLDMKHFLPNVSFASVNIQVTKSLAKLPMPGS